MKTKMIRHVRKTHAAQKGIVSVTMVALAGLGVMGLTVAGLQAIKASQTQQVVTQTNTQATVRAWSGVEAVQTYLSSLGAQAVEDIEAGPLTISGLGGLSATVVSNAEVGTGARDITVNITGRSVETTATIQAVYRLTSSTSTGTDIKSVTTEDIILKGDLRLAGNIELKGGSEANLTVLGNLTLEGAVPGINRVCSKGNMVVASSVVVKSVCVDGTLTVKDSGNVTGVADVTKLVTLDGNGKVHTINTNDGVTVFGGSSYSHTINAKKDVLIYGGFAQVENAVNAEGLIQWNSYANASVLNANGNIWYSAGDNNTQLNSKGNVRVSGSARNVNAMGDITLSGYWGQGVFGKIRGAKNLTLGMEQVVNDGIVKVGFSKGPNTASWMPYQNYKIDSSLVVNVPTVSVPTVSIELNEPPVIDVYQMKESANYVFEIENFKRKVTVRNVTGIADGVYYIGKYNYDWSKPELNRGNMDYLCTAVDGAGVCTAPTLPGRTLCMGHSAWNGCFAYDYGAKKWTIDGASMAPGSAWFDGDLLLQNGSYLNTFLSTGNIDFSGTVRLYAPNYAGYTPVCTDSRNLSPFSVTVDYRLTGIYPKDLCVGGAFVSKPLGNVALMAGGLKSGAYVGGDITVAPNAIIYGSVLAGNVFSTTGFTTIYGSVQMGRMRTSTSDTATWTGGITIDLTKGTSVFNPKEIPCMKNASGEGCSSASPEPAGVQILWTRQI